jgi:hypothetical protein
LKQKSKKARLWLECTIMGELKSGLHCGNKKSGFFLLSALSFMSKMIISADIVNEGGKIYHLKLNRLKIYIDTREI